MRIGCRYSDGQADPCRYSDGHADECRYSDGHADECRYSDGHADECRYSDGHAPFAARPRPRASGVNASAGEGHAPLRRGEGRGGRVQCEAAKAERVGCNVRLAKATRPMLCDEGPVPLGEG